ncbi:chord-domain-containing protein [Coemansia spiralis]|nr:chord-domain-containing protein [Coemansia spiralis]
MLTCTRNGCGQEYDEATNDALACQYHPGKPEFHEGLKGWTCCKSRVHSFDDFLEIKGCKLGPHSHEPKHKENPFKADLTKHEDVLPAEPCQPSKETTGSLAAAQTASSAAPQTTEPVIDEDPEDAAISPGAKCKRNGCNAVYETEERSHAAGQCQFHPGSAVFHEGTKGWTCCKPRATDFDEFMQIKGCAHGRHLFAGTQPTKNIQKVKCRKDFYQMPNSVIVSVYAKKIDKEKSSIKFTAESVQCISLCARIDPSASSFEYLSTKAEIKLVKEEVGQWPALECEAA